jgi:hypothetical protein
MTTMSRRRWLLVAVVAVVALAAQATTAGLVWQHTRPRLPALAPVAPTLEQAIAAVVTAAGNAAAVAVTGVVPYTSCQNTFLAKGSRFNRSADLYTDPGTEDTLIRRIADALSASEHPQRGAPIGGSAAPLTVDVGREVHLRVSQLGQGWVLATAETDCRTASRPQPAASTPPADATTAITGLLAAIGTTPTTWQTETVHCPTGTITTVATISPTTNTGNLPTRAATTAPATAHQFASTANRLAWHDQATSVIIAASDDGTHITAQRTTTC